MQEPNRFVIKARLTTDRNGVVNEECFEFTHLVSCVRETGVGAYFYEPNLKINIEDKSKLAYVFQIDIEHICLKLSPALRKAADFIRRANYIYDWIEVSVNKKGVVKSVENLQELRTTWPDLRKKIEADYKGGAVVPYLDEKETVLSSDEAILPCLYTYLNFGMIFPRIPAKHGDDWANSRQVFFSEYETETVEEKITYAGLNDDKRRYNVWWCNSDESAMKMVDGKGYYIMNRDSIFPESAKFQMEYRNDTITNSWNFFLEKY